MSFVFKKLFSREREPTTPNSAALDMTQSMIDFITNDTSPNDSFRSLQPDLNSSLSSLDEGRRYKSDKAETEPDFPRKVRLNITSVLNTPKRVCFVFYLKGNWHREILSEICMRLCKSRLSTKSVK